MYRARRVQSATSGHLEEVEPPLGGFERDLSHYQQAVANHVVAGRGGVDDGLAHDLGQNGFVGSKSLRNGVEVERFGVARDVRIVQLLQLQVSLEQVLEVRDWLVRVLYGGYSLRLDLVSPDLLSMRDVSASLGKIRIGEVSIGSPWTG